MSLLRSVIVTTIFTFVSIPVFAMQDSHAKPNGAAAIAAMEAQAASWGAMLHDARQMAGCKPSAASWLQAVNESVQSEMDAAISQLRQLSSEDGAEFAAHEQKIRAWVAGQAAQASGSGCKA